MNPTSIKYTENLKFKQDNKSYKPENNNVWIVVEWNSSAKEDLEKQIDLYLENATSQEDKPVRKIRVVIPKSFGQTHLGLEESSIMRNEPEDARKELSLILNSADIADENLVIQFRDQILKWFEKYQILALGSIWQYYKEKKYSPAILSEILELVGIARLNELDSEKIWLLKCVYDCENVEIRHGVVDGISNMNHDVAIAVLKEILSSERNMVLQKTISSYIEQLKNLNA